MAGPEPARPPIAASPFRETWPAALGLAFVGQLLVSCLAVVGYGGPIWIGGAIVAGFLVGVATRGPWIAGAAGIVLAAVVGGIAGAIMYPARYPLEVGAYLMVGVALAVLVFTPAYYFGGAARPASGELTPSPVSPATSDTDVAAPKTGMSRQDRVWRGILFVLLDALLVALFFALIFNGLSHMGD